MTHMRWMMIGAIIVSLAVGAHFGEWAGWLVFGVLLMYAAVQDD